MTLREAQELIALTATVFGDLLAGLQAGTLNQGNLHGARLAIEEAIRDALKESRAE